MGDPWYRLSQSDAALTNKPLTIALYLATLGLESWLVIISEVDPLVLLILAMPKQYTLSIKTVVPSRF